MAFNAEIDVQSVLNKIFVQPSSDPDISDGSSANEKIYTFLDMKQERAKLIVGLEKHYREIFAGILEQTSSVMKMQSDINNSHEARIAEFRSKFLSTYETCQVIKFERDGLRRQLVNETEKYQALLESHRNVSEQMLNFNQSCFESEHILDDVGDMITRICMMVDISRSVSTVDSTAVAQMTYPPYEPQDGDVLLVSPPTPVPQGGAARAASPLNTSVGSPMNIDYGVPVEAEGDSPVNVEADAPGDERPSDFETEIFNLKQQILALDWDRQSFQEQLQLERGENQLRGEHIQQLQEQLKQCKEAEEASFHEQARRYLELTTLRTQHDDLQRRLQIAEGSCDKLRDEKASAIGTNKHLEATNKELKQRIRSIKDSIMPLVKTELKMEWEAFMASVKREAERISSEFFLFAEKANTDQVKYYESTSALGQKYQYALEEIRVLREEMAINFRDGKYPNEPLALNQSLVTLNTQLKAALRQNDLLQEQVESRDILLESPEKAVMLARLVELEARISRLVDKDHMLTNLVRDRDREIRDVKSANEALSGHIIKMQRDFLARLRLCGEDTEGFDAARAKP